MNLKFLRSLPLEWKTHTLIWRNKPDLDTLSMDDLYNNLKIYETEVKGSSSSNQNSQNVAFVSSNNFGSSNQAYVADGFKQIKVGIAITVIKKGQFCKRSAASESNEGIKRTCEEGPLYFASMDIYIFRFFKVFKLRDSEIDSIKNLLDRFSSSKPLSPPIPKYQISVCLLFSKPDVRNGMVKSESVQLLSADYTV
ncbi:hypothetical protein Tco_1049565 [Tanacetum coccineum]